jgi:hypothetical protein
MRLYVGVDRCPKPNGIGLSTPPAITSIRVYMCLLMSIPVQETGSSTNNSTHPHRHPLAYLPPITACYGRLSPHESDNCFWKMNYWLSRLNLPQPFERSIIPTGQDGRLCWSVFESRWPLSLFCCRCRFGSEGRRSSSHSSRFHRSGGAAHHRSQERLRPARVFRRNQRSPNGPATGRLSAVSLDESSS